ANDEAKRGGEGQPDYPEDRKGFAPTEPRGELAADERPPAQTDRHSQGENGERAGTAVGREVIGDERVGRRNSARLAYPDSEPAQKKRPIAGDRSAQRSKGAPHAERTGNDGAPAGAVGKVGKRDTENGVEEREGRAANRAEFGVRKVQ